MSNSANFRQNAEQGQSLKKLTTLMSAHTTNQTTTTASVDALKLSTDTKLDTLHTDLGTLNTSVQANVPFNPNTPATYTNSHLSSISTNTNTANTHLSTIANNSALTSELKAYTDPTDNTSSINIKASTEGRLEVQVVGSDDTTGASPHRHLTIDGNGRTHTLARIEQSPTINAKLDGIISNTDKSRIVSRLTSVPSIPANTGGSSYDLGADYGSYKHLKITGDTQDVPAGDMYLQISNDNVNWNFVVGMAFITLNGGGNMGFFLSSSIQQPLRYWRIFNNSGIDSTPAFDSLMSIVSIE